MDGVTAVVVISIGLAITLLVGIASQHHGRVLAQAAPRQQPPVPPPHGAGPTREQQEDFDAVNRSIEEAREELLWLREQVARERSRLEQLRRQAPGQKPGQAFPPGSAPGLGPAPSADNPWVVLGLKPGASMEDIRRRYRLLSRVWHPDRFVDGPAELRAEAEIMMARLNRAHHALSGQAVGVRRT